MRAASVILVSLFFPGTTLAQNPDLPSRTVVVDRGAQDPAISPDGAQIAVGLLGKLWLVPIQGGRAQQLTFGPSWDAHPAWSADGQFIAYSLQRPLRAELVILNLATGGSRTLYAAPNAIGQIAFHPTRPEVLFINDFGQFEAHLWSINVSDGKLRQLTFGDGLAERSFAITPDGKAVVLETGGRGTSSLYLVTLDSLRSRRLTPAVGEEFDVHLSADGKRVIYVERIDGLEAIVQRALTDTLRHAVFASVYDGKELAVHPDGGSAILVAARRLNRLDLVSGRLTLIPFEARFTLPALGPQDLVITNARLWDATGRDVVENANVEIRAGRITRIWTGPTSSGTAPSPATIDARGRMLLPGLMDNHDHFWHSWNFHGASLLANGITTIRDPGVEISESLNLRDAIRLGTLDGPEIYTLGPLLDGSLGVHPMVDVLLTRPEAAAPLVRSLKALGVDGVKVYQSLQPGVLRTVVAEARAQGLPVSGDIGMYTSWSDAIAAGITGLNHANNYQRELLPPDLRGCHEAEPFPPCNRRLQNPPVSFFDPDLPAVDSLLHLMAVRQVAFDPTLNRFARSEARYANLGVGGSEYGRGYYAILERFLRKAVEIGVPLLAGTDNDGDELFQDSLFQELELYEHAGVPRPVILQAATINGARWLGKQDDFGTIEVGKRANLILVDGDPLKQMKDLRNISVVIKAGRIVFRHQEVP